MLKLLPKNLKDNIKRSQNLSNFTSVCFSNGAYLFVQIMEPILTSYSHKKWPLQLAAVFRIKIT